MDQEAWLNGEGKGNVEEREEEARGEVEIGRGEVEEGDARSRREMRDRGR